MRKQRNQDSNVLSHMDANIGGKGLTQLHYNISPQGPKSLGHCLLLSQAHQ